MLLMYYGVGSDFAPILFLFYVLGTFVAGCHERNFWLSIKSSFLGHMVRFDIEGNQ